MSPAAPAHHFGSAKGLLTEVALLAYSGWTLPGEAGHSDDAVEDVRALSLAFITFAVDHPGHFRLMFRNDLVNRDDPRFCRSEPEARDATGPGRGSPTAATLAADPDRFGDAADLLCGLATLHGLAHLVLEEKAAHFFGDATSRDFVKQELPKVLERLYPPKDAPG